MELTTLITLVSRETKISKIKLIGDFTRKYITEARLIIVKIAHDDLKLTHQEIGSAMGGRGKSWSCKAMIKFKENNIESSTEYQRIYSKFLTQSSLCLDCETPLLHLYSDIDTDAYGNLKHYKCKNCKKKFVRQNNGELSYSA